MRTSLPQVVGLETVRIRRIAGAVVPSLIEREEPRLFATKVRAELHLVVVDGEVRQATAKLEQLLPRVAVPLVLLDCVLRGLLGQAVLQFESDDGQAVDEEAQVQGKLGLIATVTKLPRHAKPVLAI